ncbi:transglutaminase domain-containing protein [Devosia sp.]|jgi:transglutaminase-like putative cysteine protease|uniref:transglutaminase family protein n=1 Tax=Devosia sp. TaxID=1871048 RepID=UPI0037C16D0A
MQIAIKHQIRLGLGEGVARAIQHLLLTPQTSSVQTVRDWRLEVDGLDDPTGFRDAYGNRAHLASQTRPPAELTISVSGMVETHDRAGVVGKLTGDPVPALFKRMTPAVKPVGTIVSRFRSAPSTGKDRIPLLHGLMERVGEVLTRGEPSQSHSQDGNGQSQSQGSTTEKAAPVAADFAHAFIGAARSLAIPARYVSGYLVTDDSDSPGFHAWAEAWDEGLGWIGFDAMLNLCPSERHVRVASGLDAVSAAPVRSVPVVGTPQVTEFSVSAGQ